MCHVTGFKQVASVEQSIDGACRCWSTSWRSPTGTVAQQLQKVRKVEVSSSALSTR